MSDSLVDRGCSCHLGHPPCSFCVETYECEKCGTRVEYDDEDMDASLESICTECYYKDDTKQRTEGDDIMDIVKRFC